MQDAVRSAGDSAIEVLFLKTTMCTSGCSRSALCVLPAQNIKKPQTQKSWFNKLNNMCSFIKDILPWSCLPLPCSPLLYWDCTAENTVILLVQFGIITLICAKAAASFPPLLSYHLCRSQHSEKRKERSSIIMKTLNLVDSLKMSQVYTLGTAALGCLAWCLVHSSYFSTWLLNKCLTAAWIYKPCLTQRSARLFCTKLRNRYLN